MGQRRRTERESNPPNYPAGYEDWLTLENGTMVHLRPVKPTDGALIIDLFNNLSPQSVYLRFLTPLSRLPEDWVQEFTHLDYQRNFALIALIREWGRDWSVGVGRYAFNPRTGRAELAVVIRDDIQGHGLGKALVSRVVEVGKKNGIPRFEALVSSKNQIIMKVFEQLGYGIKISPEEEGEETHFLEITTDK